MEMGQMFRERSSCTRPRSSRRNIQVGVWTWAHSPGKALRSLCRRGSHTRQVRSSLIELLCVCMCRRGEVDANDSWLHLRNLRKGGDVEYAMCKCSADPGVDRGLAGGGSRCARCIRLYLSVTILLRKITKWCRSWPNFVEFRVSNQSLILGGSSTETIVKRTLMSIYLMSQSRRETFVTVSLLPSSVYRGLR
jgi:hypothetical protein